MPAPTTKDELLEIVRKSELVPAARLDAFLREQASSAPVETPRDLSTRLVAAGLITGFQADQFLQGKYRGFTLGKYRVLERIGSGGMGTVYLCEHMSVGRKVAIKVLPTSQAGNPSALGRFYREARAAGVLDHPNLVKAHDVDRENDLHFLVMDYVDGTSLQEIVTRSGALTVPRACHYIRQAAAGLLAAHEAGLIHRDIKPANILLERNGRIRVLDLGLARFYNDDADILTLKYDDNNVLGTADYVAPEQAVNSHTVDIRADIYSLGGTFYYLLTGQVPFPGGKIAQKLIWHQMRQPTPIRQLRPEVPAEIEEIVQRMMAKDPEDRYPSPAEVMRALGPWTREPIAPPSEEEMPRLSPAASASPGSSQGTTPRPAPPVPAAAPAAPPVRRTWPSGQGKPRPQPESSGKVSALRREPVAAEVVTPRDLARAQVPTDIEHPRPAPAVSPSRLLNEKPARSESMGSLGMGLSILLIALCSGLVGVALTTWLLLR